MARKAKGGSFAQYQVRMTSAIPKALAKITHITDGKLAEFADDAAHLAQAIVKSEIAGNVRNKKPMDRKTPKRSTGRLERSIHSQHKGVMQYSVVADPVPDGGGRSYGMPDEFGHRDKSGKKIVQGRFGLIRAIWGMVAKWKRGQRWEYR